MSERSIDPPPELPTPLCRLVKIEMAGDVTVTLQTWRGRDVRYTLPGRLLRSPLALEQALVDFGLLVEQGGREWNDIITDAWRAGLEPGVAGGRDNGCEANHDAGKTRREKLLRHARGSVTHDSRGREKQ